MKTVLGVCGWIVAAVGVVAAVMLGQQLRNAQTQIKEMSKQSVLREKQVTELVAVNKAAETRATEAEKKLEAATTQAAAAPEAVQDAPDGRDSMAAALQQAMKAAGAGKGAKEGEGEEANFFKGVSQMFKGEKGKELAKASAEMQTNMQFDAFFKDLNLPPDVEARARDILNKHGEEQMMSGLKTMSEGNVDEEQLKKHQQESRKQVREDLSKVLSKDEMAQYDDYLQELPRKMIEKQYELQLSMMASTLSQESRDLVKQTVVDEMLTAAPDLGSPGSNSAANPAKAFDIQLAAIDRAREQLSTQMDPAEFAKVERFFNQQRVQLEAARNMMGGNKPANAPAQK
jgi:hypothetical protein